MHQHEFTDEREQEREVQQHELSDEPEQKTSPGNVAGLSRMSLFAFSPYPKVIRSDVFSTQFLCKAIYVPGEPRRDPSDRRLYEHGV